MQKIKVAAAMVLCCSLVVAGATYLVTALSPAQEAVAEDNIHSGVTFEKDALSIQTQDGRTLPFKIELALRPDQQAQGMMHRTQMGDDEGMLFVFPYAARPAFWMKDTLIPLDMLFIAEDGTIHHIHPGARPQDLTNITAVAPSKAVLELKGGVSERLGVKEGDRVMYKAFEAAQIPQ